MANPFRARGRTQHVPGRMNGLETKYASLLNDRKMVGEIHSWRFESIKLRLANNTFLTPDFLVVLADGSVELHEVKARWKKEDRAHWEDDARVKVKIAAEIYPEFRFIGVSWDSREGWKYEQFN